MSQYKQVIKGITHGIEDINLQDIKEGFYSQQKRIDAFAKELGMDKYVLRDYIRTKVKPGIKFLGQKLTNKKIFGYLDEVSREVYGKRIFRDVLTNKDIKEMSKTLSEISQKHQLKIQESKARGPTSKITPFKESGYGPRPNYPISPLPRLKHLTKLHEIPWKVVQNALDAAKSQGWSEKRIIKQLINSLDNEETPSGELRKFIEDQTKKITDPRGLRIDRLKDYVKNETDIRWRTIQNALDMGKSPKVILDDLTGNLGQDEHRYAEDLQKEFKEWNKQRRARDKLRKSASNKIVPKPNEKSIQRDINRLQTKIIQNEVEQANIVDRMRDNVQKGRDAVRDDRKKFPKKLIKNRLDLKSKFKKSRPTIRWTPSDDPFDRKIGWGKTTYGRGKIWKGSDLANRASLQIKELADLSKQSGEAAQDLFDKNPAEAKRLYKRYLNPGYKPLNALKSGLGNLGAGIVLNALSDKYLMPLAEKAGTKLGKSLLHIGRKVDDALPGINSRDERRRTGDQLLIRKKKKDD